MSKAEAHGLVEAHLMLWRRRSYSELALLIGTQTCSELVGPSGTTYQVEIEPIWDASRGGNIRVIAAIDGGDVSTLRPITTAFILAPDGHFVDEDP